MSVESTLFRVFRHLLPDALAWRILQGSVEWEIGEDHEIGEEDLLIGGRFGGRTLSRFFEGLADGAPTAAIEYSDAVFGDLFPDTTRQLAEWEEQFGIPPNDDETERRLNLAAAWAAGGGQDPAYIQGVLHTAGFTNVFIHEWWEPPNEAPRVARDPRAPLTEQPRIGTVQCGEPLALCGERDAQCNAFLANDPRYFNNKTLLPVAPPPIPDDPSYWPYFLYFGGETFGEDAIVSPSRRDELERLILKLRPAQHWIVTLITYEDYV